MPKQPNAGFPGLNQMWHAISLSIPLSNAAFSTGCSNFKIELFHQTHMTLLNSLVMFRLIILSVTKKRNKQLGQKWKKQNKTDIIGSCLGFSCTFCFFPNSQCATSREEIENLDLLSWLWCGCYSAHKSHPNIVSDKVNFIMATALGTPQKLWNARGRLLTYWQVKAKSDRQCGATDPKLSAMSLDARSQLDVGNFETSTTLLLKDPEPFFVGCFLLWRHMLS